jgi:hypothetical protein
MMSELTSAKRTQTYHTVGVAQRVAIKREKGRKEIKWPQRNEAAGERSNAIWSSEILSASAGKADLTSHHSTSSQIAAQVAAREK